MIKIQIEKTIDIPMYLICNYIDNHNPIVKDIIEKYHEIVPTYTNESIGIESNERFYINFKSSLIHVLYYKNNLKFMTTTVIKKCLK